MSEAAAKPIHTVSVRELVEFVLRRGDLGGEREFVGSDRALAGIRGHQKIQRSRPTGYLTELPVEHRVEVEEFTLLIRGRIDGLLITSERVLLEEIKTVSASWKHEPDPLHWAQAKFYGFMHAHENALKELVLQLVYLELPAGKVTEFRETVSFAELSEFFATTTTEYVSLAAGSSSLVSRPGCLHRGTGFSVSAISSRPAGTGRGRLSRPGQRWPIIPRGSHRHRENHLHPVPGGQSFEGRKTRTHLLSDGPHRRTRHRRESVG
jgi:hypothetical protein